MVEAAGIEIGIEPLNRFETYFLNTAADAARLCEEIGSPRVGILVDTFHANIEEKSIGAALRHAGSHLKHLHVCENDRGIPGSGHVAWAEFFSTVAELGYDRWMTIESFGFSLGGLSTAAAVWRDLAPTPDAIAFEGVSSSAPTRRGVPAADPDWQRIQALPKGPITRTRGAARPNTGLAVRLKFCYRPRQLPSWIHAQGCRRSLLVMLGFTTSAAAQAGPAPVTPPAATTPEIPRSRRTRMVSSRRGSPPW